MHAFRNCLSLKQLCIPEGVQSLGAHSFSGCQMLEQLLLPVSIKHIGSFAFRGCRNLKQVFFGGTIQQFNETIRQGRNGGNLHRVRCIDGEWSNILQTESQGLSYKINNDSTYTLVGIGDCKDSNIIVPQSHDGFPITKIGDDAFSHQPNITSISLSSSIKTIGDRSFFNCKNLSHINFGTSIEDIGESAFGCCSKLTEIQLPPSVVRIRDYAFDACIQLSSAILSIGLSIIGAYAFSDCVRLDTIFVPKNVLHIGTAALNCCKLIICDDENSMFSSENGVLFNKAKTQIICYPQRNERDHYTIPQGITKILAGAFENCSNLSTIKYPCTLNEISEDAFNNCNNLFSFRMYRTHPCKAEKISIQSRAFYLCKSLLSFNVSRVNYIGSRAFEYCDNLSLYSYSKLPDENLIQTWGIGWNDKNSLIGTKHIIKREPEDNNCGFDFNWENS